MAYDRERLKRTKRNCSFCKNNIEQLDYKDVDTLKQFLTEYGRITPRYINGNCAKHQRMLASAIKRARFMALLPYVGAIHAEE